MTVNEFKAWLEGFEESFNGRPTQAQWKKVKARLDGVYDGEYHHWYQGSPQRPWWPTWWISTIPYSDSVGNPVTGTNITLSNDAVYGDAAETIYCSNAFEIGRSEGAELTAGSGVQ